MTTIAGDAAPSVGLCLTGDVMCGRGIDQILGHPGDPAIFETWAKSAKRYVELAEQRSGPIPHGVDPEYIWGEMLGVVRDPNLAAVVVNLETAVTNRGAPWSGKRIHYRMHPANIECLTTAGIDVAVLANNHVLDWSIPGLEQTLDALHGSDIATAGAGRGERQAWTPAIVGGSDGRRVLVFGVGSRCSGVPREWTADASRGGVALLPDLSGHTVDRIGRMVQRWARPEDLVVLSIHWGSNWGHAVSKERRRFAHGLIDDAGVHLVHGHSSHHPMQIEVHHNAPILYGCGDLITDYEGIRGHESYRGEIGALYLPTFDASTGTLRALELVPTKVERFRLIRPRQADRQWLADVLSREGAASGTTVSTSDSGTLVVEW